MANDLTSIYEEFRARGIASPHDAEIRSAIRQAEAVSDFFAAVGRGGGRLFRAIATSFSVGHGGAQSASH